MVFKKFLEKLKQGFKVEPENVDITEDFERKYEEYQERAKKRHVDKNVNP